MPSSVTMKAGRQIYQEVRQRRRAFAWRNRALLLKFLPVWLAAGVVVSLLVGAGINAEVAYFFGGAWAVGGAWFVAYFIQLEGWLYRRLGGSAEEWTAEEFRKLGRRHWSALHHVQFDGFDIDHVVFGPSQILAVETKYRSEMDLDATGTFVEVPEGWLRQARCGARRIRLLLKSYGIDRDVRPIIVVWGPGAAKASEPWRRFDDAVVLMGARARNWRRIYVESPLSREQRERAEAAVKDYMRQHAEWKATA